MSDNPMLHEGPENSPRFVCTDVSGMMQLLEVVTNRNGQELGREGNRRAAICFALVGACVGPGVCSQSTAQFVLSKVDARMSANGCTPHQPLALERAAQPLVCASIQPVRRIVFVQNATP